MNYPRVKDNQWVRPMRLGYKMMCCDCGLVHELDFKIIKEGKRRSVLLFRARRNVRSTSASRRNMPDAIKRYLNGKNT